MAVTSGHGCGVQWPQCGPVATHNLRPSTTGQRPASAGLDNHAASLSSSVKDAVGKALPVP